MIEILGYGEDALTLWALRHRTHEILDKLKDKTATSDCLIFYRPSFGRRGGESSPEFGEFDAIIASPNNIYLVESKWDNLARFNREAITLKTEQKVRHDILRWFVTHWDSQYKGNWERFAEEQGRYLQNKPIARSSALLTKNLEHVLTKLHECCPNAKSKENVKDVLLFFYDGKKSKIPAPPEGFELVDIEYSGYMEGTFIPI